MENSYPMEAALAEARRAPEHGDIPVGAVVVDPDGAVVASDHNRRALLFDPTAHAEVLVLAAAARARRSWRLDGHTLVVTLEPCAMCAGAAVNARLERIVYGAPDPTAGACWSLYNIPQDRRLNHSVELVAGVMADVSATLLSEFFAERR
jgi:tRNA(adenine34) deaminase